MHAKLENTRAIIDEVRFFFFLRSYLIIHIRVVVAMKISAYLNLHLLYEKTEINDLYPL